MLKNDFPMRKRVKNIKMNKNSYCIINIQKIVDFVQNRRIIKKITCCKTDRKNDRRGRRKRDELENFYRRTGRYDGT
jgi:hypothetical protein